MVFGEGDAAGRCEIAAGGCGHPVGISDTAGKQYEGGFVGIGGHGLMSPQRPGALRAPWVLHLGQGAHLVAG